MTTAPRVARSFRALGLAWFAFLLLVALPPNTARAEGSLQVGLGQSFYEYGGVNTDSFPTIDRPLYVDIFEAGEIVNVSLCGNADSDVLQVQIFETSPGVDGRPVTGTKVLDVTTAATVSCSDGFGAPLSGAVTFDSGTRDYAYGGYDVFEIRLINTGGDLFRRFDVTVTPDAVTLPDPSGAGATGRLWAYSWAYSAGSFAKSAATDGDYYTLAPGGVAGSNFVWKLDLNNFAGYGYDIVANGVGVEAPSSGLSAPSAGNSVTPDYPVFVNYPERALTLPPPEPAATNVRFEDDAGVDSSISPGVTIGVQDTGFFYFDSNVDGVYAITIDVNQDGSYAAGDVLLLGEAVKGANSVRWDGLDNAGDPVPVGSYNAQIQLRIGEFHFVASDVETSGGDEPGLTIERAFPGGATEQVPVFWDDATLLGGTTTLPDGLLGGRHTWGNFSGSGFGDQRYIDTYVYGDVANEVEGVTVAADDGPLPPDLAIDVQASRSPVRSGESFVYTVTVENRSSANGATGVVIRDVLPDGLEPVATSGCAGDPVGLPDCAVGDLAPSGSVQVTFEVRVTATVDGEIVNQASVSLNESDPDPSDNSDSATITVIAGVSVAGTVYHDRAPNGRLDGADGATGLTLWVKRVAESDGDCASVDGGPAAEAVAVAVDGSYTFAAVLDGTWCLLLDDNDTLSDVAPFDAGAAGWVFVDPPAGVRVASVAGAALAEQDFGLFAGSVVRGAVFRDDGRLASGGAAASDPAFANDGRRDAAEPGLPGVTVTATDGAATRSATTDGGGGYTLYLPAAWSAPVTLSHPQRPASGVDDGALPRLATSWGGADAASVVFTPTAGGSASYDFGVVAGSELRPDRQGRARSPGAAVYGHLYTPGTLGTVTLSLTGGRWSYRAFLDSDCDGVVAAAEQNDVLTSGFTVGADWPRSADGALAACALELHVAVPAGEPDGRLDLALLTAELSWQSNAAVRDGRTVSDATTAASGAVEASKRVRNVTAGTPFGTIGEGAPSDELEYCIAYRNLGTEAVTDAEVLDPVPHFTALVVGSAGASATYSNDDGAGYGYTPVADGDGLDGAVDAIRWSLGAVAAGASGEVCYRVAIE